MIKLKNYIIPLFLGFCFQGMAGGSPLFLYKYTENVFLFPSLAGYNGGSTYLSHQMNFTGFDNAPQQTLLGVNLLKGKEHLGFGFNAMNQQGFGINEFYANIPLAYYVPLSQKLQLSFGLSADLYNRQLGGTDLFVADVDDPEINNAQEDFYDASFSTALHHSFFTVAASFNHLNGWANTGNSLGGTFTGFFQADIPLTNEYNRIEWANTFVYSLNRQDVIWNTQAFYEIIQYVIIGGGYSSNQQIISSLGLHYNNRWLLGYAFYYNVNSTHASQFKNGHEITLKFHFDKQYYEQHKYSKYAIRKGAMLKK